MDVEATHEQARTLTFSNVADRVVDKSRPDGYKTILSGISGSVAPGQLLAVMGPSGAGKSTFLDALAGRSHRVVGGTIQYGGESHWDRRRWSSYVEQEDALLGVLTVRETLTYAARLGLGKDVDVKAAVEKTITQLGLTRVADQMIGTPIQRGISGGQKRRVSVGTSLVTSPNILFLDEPTSGLDSATSKEVLAAIATAAREQGTIVIATIHQPAWDTLSIFHHLLVLARGRPVYNDKVSSLVPWLSNKGHPVQPHRNPADALMELINDDFTQSGQPNSLFEKLPHSSASLTHTTESPSTITQAPKNKSTGRGERMTMSFGDQIRKTLILMERNAVNYRRNLLSYGIRLGMYIGLGVLLATVWVRLGNSADRINDRLSVHFFSVAFLSFMSVAGIPSFLEERAVFMRERNNGLYSSSHYVIANSLVNLPFLFVCSLAFMLIMYWAIGLHPGATAFFRFTAFLFLAIYAAESQCLLIAAFVPIFVAALALAAFANGFWMCVQGYFIRAVNLPKFWYYSFHWMDYETFAFNSIAKSDLSGLTFPCSGNISQGNCSCPYTSSLASKGECSLSGDDVLKALNIDGGDFLLYGFILVIIIIVYRFLFWLGLTLRKH